MVRLYDDEHYQVHSVWEGVVYNLDAQSVDGLEARIKDAIRAWEEDHVDPPTTFRVTDVQEYVFTFDEVVAYQDDDVMPDVEGALNE